jgi:hypothetical protein
MAFKRSGTGYVAVWFGDPDCQACHDWMLDWLRRLGTSFFAEESMFSISVQGNLGECIAHSIGATYEFPSIQSFAANALQPLRKISKPDIDIVWVYFGQTLDEDRAIVQEVKTTGQHSLDLADRLIPDYDKLFGTEISLTLHSRLMDIKNKMEFEHNRLDLARRITYLAANSPRTSSKIQLLPTLVFDLEAGDPEPKMLSVRSALCGKGWSTDAVSAWAVGVSDLGARLIRLSVGNN